MNELSQVVLTTAYFPPISNFSAMMGAARVYLEACENYQRQTYRNRCSLYMANGVGSLTVPVERGNGQKTPIKEVRIAYHMPWQNQHFRAIESAYRRSPFYEFYIDDLKPYFEEKPVYLYDLNGRILKTLCGLIGLPLSILDTQEFLPQLSPETFDCRELRESPTPRFTLPPYEQVFGLKYGFQQNLSILDALFHLGPETIDWLEKGKKHFEI